MSELKDLTDISNDFLGSYTAWEIHQLENLYQSALINRKKEGTSEWEGDSTKLTQVTDYIRTTIMRNRSNSYYTYLVDSTKEYAIFLHGEGTKTEPYGNFKSEYFKMMINFVTRYSREQETNIFIEIPNNDKSYLAKVAKDFEININPGIYEFDFQTNKWTYHEPTKSEP